MYAWSDLDTGRIDHSEVLWLGRLMYQGLNDAYMPAFETQARPVSNYVNAAIPDLH